MMVVADAGPLQYLIRIGVINVLARLYKRVLVPQTVAEELQHENTPVVVRAWIGQPPAWCEVRPDSPDDGTLAFLDPGERAAIALVQSLRADRVLMDDREGRAEAKRRRLRITGTLGVLAEAHLAGLLTFDQAVAELRKTNFYISEEAVAELRQRLTRAEDK